ncbi:hypothetical protein [uncultured Methanobacterium sp.]|uniref:hypothetical protein n=1 Tax=uncultured Methanobacterium sp. TaxID=176306 RepID=UPI002AA71B2C|nr:hypothetical protein [uncultured Methanobacterium sp.]
MSIRFYPRIPDESVVKLYKQKVEEKHGRLFASLGEETEQALKLHLMIKFEVDFPDDLRLEQLLDRYLGVAHTRDQYNNMENNGDLSTQTQPENCKTKKERAYFAMNYLKRNHLEQITHHDYTLATTKLFGQSDYRTIKSNLEILVNIKELTKVPMRNIGKRNRHKQLYRFKDNEIYNKYNKTKSLQEFTRTFKERFKDRSQVTLTEIKIFLEEDYIITDSQFVEERADLLKQEGIIKKYAINPENTVFNFC